MISVVIAAHNEASVISATVGQLMTEPEAMEIVVVANGCQDDTADVAARAGAQVIDLPLPGKAHALNAGDRAAVSFPRAYLDADIVPPDGGLQRLREALEEPQVLAVVPQRRLEFAGRPLIVRWYYTISARHPAFEEGLFGRGLIMLSEAGRARFAEFPDALADDLYLDSLFTASERRLVRDVVVSVETPFTVGALTKRLARVRRGNRQLRSQQAAIGGAEIRASHPWAWLTAVVAREPWLLPHGLVYAAVTLWASHLANGEDTTKEWGHDMTTRVSESSA